MNVEITLEFNNRPSKQDVYNYLSELLRDNSLRYDIEGELDSQLTSCLSRINIKALETRNPHLATHT